MQNRIRHPLQSISKEHHVLSSTPVNLAAWPVALPASTVIGMSGFFTWENLGDIFPIDLEHKPEVIELPIVDELGNQRLVPQKGQLVSGIP